LLHLWLKCCTKPTRLRQDLCCERCRSFSRVVFTVHGQATSEFSVTHSGLASLTATNRTRHTIAEYTFMLAHYPTAALKYDLSVLKAVSITNSSIFALRNGIVSLAYIAVTESTVYFTYYHYACEKIRAKKRTW